MMRGDARAIAAAASFRMERGSLPRAVKVALDAYRTALRDAFGDRLKELRLFGSSAAEEVAAAETFIGEARRFLVAAGLLDAT